jgi:hypothetical protein
MFHAGNRDPDAGTPAPVVHGLAISQLSTVPEQSHRTSFTMSRTCLFPLLWENPRQSPITRTDRARSSPCTLIGPKRKTKKRRRGGRETRTGYLSLYVSAEKIKSKSTLIIDNSQLICATDRFVFGDGRRFYHGDLPEPPAEPAGHEHVLPRDHRSDPSHFHLDQRVVDTNLAAAAPHPRAAE